MHRFYCSKKNILRNKIIIDDWKELHYIRDVLRLSVNDKVVVFDGKGCQYFCSLKELQKNRARLEIQDKKISKTTGIKLTIACAVPKKSKMDDIIDKLTQLGVDRIIPLNTKRVIVKLDKNKTISRHQRWQKIAQSASGQSQRNSLPIIDPIKSIGEVLSESGDYDLKIIATLNNAGMALKDTLTNTKAKNILVLIGPEGDFAPEEVRLAKQAGCIPVSLGNLVLRVETAAIAAASFIKLYEDS